MTLQEAKDKIAAATVFKTWETLEQELRGTEDYANFMVMASIELEIVCASLRSELALKEKQLEAADKVIELSVPMQKDVDEYRNATKVYDQLKNTKP